MAARALSTLAGRLLTWLGYAWIVALFAAHALGEWIGFSDPLSGLALPVRFLVTVALSIPGIGLVLMGRHLISRK